MLVNFILLMVLETGESRTASAEQAQPAMLTLPYPRAAVVVLAFVKGYDHLRHVRTPLVRTLYEDGAHPLPPAAPTHDS